MLANGSMGAKDTINFANYFELADCTRCIAGLLGDHENSRFAFKMGYPLNKFYTSWNFAYDKIEEYVEAECDDDDATRVRSMMEEYCRKADEAEAGKTTSEPSHSSSTLPRKESGSEPLPDRATLDKPRQSFQDATKEEVETSPESAIPSATPEQKHED